MNIGGASITEFIEAAPNSPFASLEKAHHRGRCLVNGDIPKGNALIAEDEPSQNPFRQPDTPRANTRTAFHVSPDKSGWPPSPFSHSLL